MKFNNQIYISLVKNVKRQVHVVESRNPIELFELDVGLRVPNFQTDRRTVMHLK